MQNSLTEISRADHFKLLPEEERKARLASLSDQEIADLEFDWGWWARPSQMLPGDVNPRTPDGSWVTWLAMAGRGWGKTRVGAETVRMWIKNFPMVSLVGATADDARDIMIEGESGILACCPKGERPLYLPSKRRLEWPNGGRSLIFTADEPERLRGKQHMKFWADELGAWRYAEAWDQLAFGLRLGANPQGIVTTTPRPNALVKALAADPTTFITRGSTYDNKGNLAGAFLHKILTKYEGTRLGRQEIEAELLEDNPGALWQRAMIDSTRLATGAAPELQRVAVGVDPAVTAKENSDLTGIIVAGMDNQRPPHFYVLDDRSLIATPEQWSSVAVAAYHRHQADRVVAEVNNGGDLVETIIRHKDANIPFTAVHATRGKAVRAEPIAALYEQGRVHHVGSFPALEDQMCDWDPAMSTKSPDRVDALVWVLTELSAASDCFGLLDWLEEQVAAANREEQSAGPPGDVVIRTNEGVEG
jgi:phage terminase large subunit-like protein